MKELCFFNGFSIDCRGQKNIGAIMQYLEPYSKISTYSSIDEIIENEFITIYKSGIYHESEIKKDFKIIQGSDFLKQYAFQKIYYSPDFDKFSLSMKSKVNKSYEKMEKAFREKKTVCEDGTSREYHKGILNFYYEMMSELGSNGELNSTEDIKLLN